METKIYCFGMSDYMNTYWTAFYTKPRNEKKAAERLAKNGFEVYCPTRTVVKQWSDRKKKVSEPLFTSYLFAKVNELTRMEILLDSGIISNVYWLGQPAVIRDIEIQEIKSFLEDYSSCEIELKDLTGGNNVIVESGPLSGQTGIIRHIQGNRAFLSISSLGIEMQAEISLGHLKKVG